MPERFSSLTSDDGATRRARSLPVTGRIVLGLIVIAMGVIFTLDNMGVIEGGEILRWWPVLMIGYGLMRLAGLSGPRNLVIGSIFTFLGGWLLLNSLGLVRFDLFDLWPVLLILLGISIVSRALGPQRRFAGVIGAMGGGGMPRISAFALMSGTRMNVTSQEFRGGDVTALMGGHKIDLRAAKLAGGEATLDLLVIWGGVDLLVPESWEVANEAVALMGGIDDQSRPAQAPTARLVLRGLVLMGGVEVRTRPAAA